VPAIRDIQLVELHVESGTPLVCKISFKAEDVFAMLEDKDIQLTIQHRRLRAVFLFHFKGDAKPRRVTIKPRNQTSYQHDADSRVVAAWMIKRGFAKTTPPAKEVQDVSHLESS
jgi:polyphosphate kinase